MARKHHTKHNRGPSNYKRRLAARGLTHAPRLDDVETLRKRQTRERAASPWQSDAA